MVYVACVLLASTALGVLPFGSASPDTFESGHRDSLAVHADIGSHFPEELLLA